MDGGCVDTVSSKRKAQMRKQAFFLSTALVAAGTVAMAAPPLHVPKGAALGVNGAGAPFAVNMNYAGTAGQVANPALLSGGKINYFSKEAKAPFVSWSGQLVGCAFAGCYQEAEAFTPAVSATSKSVTLGLMAWNKSAYTYQADVSIYSDADGVPGNALATDTVTAAPDFGPCCTPIKAKLQVALTAGTQYWIVVGPSTSTDALIWAAQDVDFVDKATLASSQNGGSWTAFQSVGYGYILR